MARKSCNYLEDAIEVGFEIVVDVGVGVGVDIILVTRMTGL